jgi:hypothetical protein
VQILKLKNSKNQYRTVWIENKTLDNNTFKALHITSLPRGESTIPSAKDDQREIKFHRNEIQDKSPELTLPWGYN